MFEYMDILILILNLYLYLKPVPMQPFLLGRYLVILSNFTRMNILQLSINQTVSILIVIRLETYVYIIYDINI